MALLECIDKRGIPHKDKDGVLQEPPAMFNGQIFEFQPGEQIMMESSVASWWCSRARYLGRFRILDKHPVIHAIVKDGKLIPVNEQGNPLGMQTVLEPEDTAEIKDQDGLKVRMGEHPSKRLAGYNKDLEAGKPGDVTVG